MIIAFEGMPGVGKTSLARAVHYHCGWPLVGEWVLGEVEPTDPFRRRPYILNDFAKISLARAVGGHALLDRCALSTVACTAALYGLKRVEELEPLIDSYACADALPDAIVFVDGVGQIRSDAPAPWRDHELYRRVSVIYETMLGMSVVAARLLIRTTVSHLAVHSNILPLRIAQLVESRR
jgi:hypothetical protein